MRHWSYLKYVIRHKWFVFIASWKTDCSLWRAITHDMSKFLPSEWFPYATTFYKKDGSKQYNETPALNMAWNYHQHRNKHHWQYWVLKQDDGDLFPLEMPIKYVREMVADWAGAGKAITGKWEVRDWYLKNKNKIILHPQTRIDVNEFIGRF